MERNWEAAFIYFSLILFSIEAELNVLTNGYLGPSFDTTQLYRLILISLVCHEEPVTCYITATLVPWSFAERELSLFLILEYYELI